MKRTEINLAGPFPEAFAALLALPGTASKPGGNHHRDVGLNQAFRWLYEAANGRQVQTAVGFIAIAPPVAAFLKDQPYDVATQDEFFLEAFARILTGEPGMDKNLTNRTWSHEGKLATIEPDRNETTSMKKPTIVMTAADHKELTHAIAAAAKLSERGRYETNALKAEISRAKVVNAGRNLPPDVITMNSRAELLDLERGERMEFTLVFPVDADIEAGKISVLAPLGTAMLGYRVGDEFEWPVPYGLRRLKVERVYFQPEAVLKKSDVRTSHVTESPLSGRCLTHRSMVPSYVAV